MWAPDEMSHPLPIVRPPDPSMTVKAPIHVPPHWTGSPMTHACSFQGFWVGRPEKSPPAPDQVGHSRPHIDLRLESQDLDGA